MVAWMGLVGVSVNGNVNVSARACTAALAKNSASFAFALWLVCMCVCVYLVYSLCGTVQQCSSAGRSGGWADRRAGGLCLCLGVRIRSYLCTVLPAGFAWDWCCCVRAVLSFLEVRDGWFRGTSVVQGVPVAVTLNRCIRT